MSKPCNDTCPAFRGIRCDHELGHPGVHHGEDEKNGYTWDKLPDNPMRYEVVNVVMWPKNLQVQIRCADC